MEGFTVEQDSPLTAWGQVQRDLRQRIEAGEFGPASRIPSEAALSTHYGVSRVTVRRAIEALVVDGYLTSRKGSGTYVADRDDLVKCDVDLLRPWREQLLATGNVARNRMVEFTASREVPADLRPTVLHDDPRQFAFGRHVQEVNGVAIAVTESWVPVDGRAIVVQRPPSAPVSGSSSVRIVPANTSQARLLNSYRDAALLEVTTCSRLRQTGELVELARTSWVASRVRFTYGRSLTVGQIDMSELLSRSGHR
jgi:GntR family transcriptional regulator